MTLPLVTACTNDDAIEDNTRKGEKVTVRLRLSQAAPAMTRAWQDTNAKDQEMMNIWTVVITDNAGNVKHILKGTPSEDHREIDPIETDIELETGSYKFYSFANIGDSNLETLLGFTDGTISTPNPTGIVFPTNGKTLDNYTAKVNGNLFNPSAADNGLGAKGIPMSNMQEITVDESTTTINLIVVRMLAKIELQIYNDKATPITINSITLTDITKYDAAKENLKLFPSYKNSNSANTMEPVHGDIQPNLTDDATTAPLEITQSPSGVTASQDSWTIDANNYNNGNGTPLKISFYVNESKNPKGENWGNNGGTLQQFNHYFLKIKINGEEEARYTLIDDSNADNGDTGKWNYIARNDYRIIPIVLDDYKLDMIPYDFPAIGVYPASMKEEDGIYTITFHDYGHFHLQPQVTKYSDTNNPKKVVPYGSSSATDDDKTYWTLVKENGTETWANSWGSWTDATKEHVYSGDFYRTSTDTKDGDDAGGVPVWYKNDGTNGSPQWSPDGVNYPPFIFGYIADPKGKPATDKKVYHEFSINLYKQGTGAARQMTYRLYMILDTDQMMYRSRALGAPAARHTHGH